jgi:hypothetical protein
MLVVFKHCCYACAQPAAVHHRRSSFKRSHDGHVALLNRFSKQWTDVKCDLQVPGLLLLRESSGQVRLWRCNV